MRLAPWGSKCVRGRAWASCRWSVMADRGLLKAIGLLRQNGFLRPVGLRTFARRRFEIGFARRRAPSCETFDATDSTGRNQNLTVARVAPYGDKVVADFGNCPGKIDPPRDPLR